MERKSQIRKIYKERRDAIPKTIAKELSIKLSEHILHWTVYKEAKQVFFYYPLGQEASLLPVVEDALVHNKQVAFPKVSGNIMDFYEISGLSQLSEGCFHVMEPQIVSKQGDYPKLADWSHALCFVPGVVFDLSGARFGYGKGYYDHYFTEKSGCRLVGCAYQCQITERLPEDVWDIKMDHLITENGILK